MNLHNFCFIGGIVTKLKSKTNINKTRKITCDFIDNYIISGNYDVMTDSSKSVRFMWHKKFSEVS